MVFIQLSILSLACLIYMIYDEKNDGFFSEMSMTLNFTAQSYHRKDLIKFNRAVTRLGGVLVLTIAFTVLAVYFFANGMLMYAGITALAGFGGVGMSELMKKIMKRPRPKNSLQKMRSHSFPSGHVTMSTLFYGMLIFLFKPGFFATILLILLVILIAKSRVYLRVHWLSDVLAGFFLGFFWLNFVLSLV